MTTYRKKHRWENYSNRNAKKYFELQIQDDFVPCSDHMKFFLKKSSLFFKNPIWRALRKTYYLINYFGYEIILKKYKKNATIYIFMVFNIIWSSFSFGTPNSDKNDCHGFRFIFFFTVFAFFLAQNTRNQAEFNFLRNMPDPVIQTLSISLSFWQDLKY